MSDRDHILPWVDPELPTPLFKKPAAPAPESLAQRALGLLGGGESPIARSMPSARAQERLMDGAQACNAMEIRRALEMGADPLLPLPADKGNPRPALLVVAAEQVNNSKPNPPMEHRLECLALLLPYCDPDAVDGRGRTALMIAAANQSAQVVKALLPVSDLRKTDIDGRTALMIAAQTLGEECVRLLLPGSDPKQEGRFGETALGLACQKARVGIAKMLLPVSDVAGSEGHMTPLMHAARAGSSELVALLLPRSNPKAVDHEGLTALYHAATQGDAKSVGMLLPVSDWQNLMKGDGTVSNRTMWRVRDICAKSPGEPVLAGALAAIDEGIEIGHASRRAEGAAEPAPAARPRF